MRLTLKDFDFNCLDLTQVERTMADARMTGYAISDMNDYEVKAATTGIIFKVSVICGSQLPTHDVHITALENEFVIFLKQPLYEILTVEEILIAFRMNANFQLQDKIETYGAIFNIDYASKILKQFVNKRFAFDRKLTEIHRDNETIKVLNEEENKRRLKVIEQFNKFLEDENAELDLSNCYMQLVYDGAFVNKSADKTFMQQATRELPRGESSVFAKRLATGGIDLDASFLAGKMAVKYLFQQMKLTGRLEIYNGQMQLLHPGFEIPENRETKAF